jgi:D-amino-acid dehydrogenase
MTLTIAIIGTGIIGALAAFEAQRDGHRVIMIEPGPPGGPQAASFGNAAWIYGGSLLPISTPGLWRQIPSYLADPLGPFAIRWRHLPRAAPWLWRFVRAGSTLDRIEACARARHALLEGTLGRYEAIARDAGLSRFLKREGLLFVYPARADFLKEALGWRLRRERGLVWEEWDEAQLRLREPALGPAYRFGVFYPDAGNLTDPGGFVAGLVEHVVRNGGTLVQARATGFDIRGGQLSAVLTDTGPIACDRALICAGIAGSRLSREAGDTIPLESERGYHLVVANPACLPRRPLMPSDGKMGVTMTAAGLRIAGQVEIAGTKAPPDWRRVDILRQWLDRLVPGAAAPSAPVTRWMGHRPSTPDGLPCLGPARASRDILHGYGHGHSGLGMGPGSARLLVDLATGRKPAIDPAPYGAERFR